MSRNLKIGLLIGGLVVFSCALLCIASALILPRFAQNTIVQDPEQARKIGQQIADYTLPPGYNQSMGMDFFTTQMVIITPTNGKGAYIILFQVKTAMSREQMEQQMQQAMQRQFQGGAYQRVGEEPVTIQGKTTSLTVSESQSSRGQLRQATGIFSAKGGVGMIMVSGSTSDWNWQLVKNFCESIR